MSSRLVIAAGVLAFLAGPVAAEDMGDPEKGAKVFKKCKACHNVDKEKNKLGPHLVGVYGRKAASVEGYKYGKGILAKAEEIGEWNSENLDGYLTNPKSFIAGKSKMSFKLKKEDQRRDVIAYLKSLSEKAKSE